MAEKFDSFTGCLLIETMGFNMKYALVLAFGLMLGYGGGYSAGKAAALHPRLLSTLSKVEAGLDDFHGVAGAAETISKDIHDIKGIFKNPFHRNQYGDMEMDTAGKTQGGK